MTQTVDLPTVSSPAGHGVHRSDSRPPARRGRLKNGNPCGDFLAAPRCGAHTRCGGTCRQPAMRNGRCRLHGGLSTGPRTPAGLSRSRCARWKHGARSAEVTALRRAARAQLRRVRTLLAGTRISAGHGVHRSDSAATSGMRAAKINHREHRGHRAAASSARAARHHPFSVPSVSSVVNLSSSAGHGLHRSVAHPQPIGVHPRSSAAKSFFSAGHGVYRSNPQPRRPALVLPSRRERLHCSASIGGLTYAVPLGMGSIA